MNTIIISGSSRKNGNTEIITSELSNILICNVIHLSDYNIKHYDYTHENKNDDFLKLISSLISKYDTFIIATPVYWYAMSGLMKVFFDRLTELITIKKELGRKLTNKNIAVITSSNGDNLGNNFWLPFKATAKYLNLNYIDNIHTIANSNNSDLILHFSNKIKQVTKHH